MSAKRILLETSTGKLSVAQGTTTIGRSRSCGIRLEDLSASRNHAMITRDGDRVTVRDLESSNGTFLNGERLNLEVELQHGDLVTIGESDLRLAILGDDADLGSDTRASADDLSTQYAPRVLGSIPSSSEAIAVGDAMPVGDVLAHSKPAWKSTGVLPAAAPADSALAFSPPHPSSVNQAAGPPPKAASSESAELLPSIEDIERQLAVQESSPRPAQARATTTRIQPAGFLRRLLAQLIDFFIVLVVAVGASFFGGGPMEAAGGMVMSIAAMLVAVLLHVVSWTMGGASPGKRALGLVVCDDKGRVGLSFGRALLRYVGYMVSSIPLGAGYLIPLFHPQKKALHDLLAGTYVGRR